MCQNGVLKRCESSAWGDIGLCDDDVVVAPPPISSGGDVMLPEEAPSLPEEAPPLR